MASPRRYEGIYGALLCAGVLFACVLISHPAAEMGVMDDWSYIYSAKRLAETGHVVYNGWATAMIGWQMYLGALFFKVFGFSFFVARMSVLLVGMATAVLLQRTLVRIGVNGWNATLGTLAVVLSPLFQALSFTFMTDVPGSFALVLCLYGCVRAVGADTDQAAVWWMVMAAVTNMGLGTVRQTSWLGILVLVPSTAWVMRRRRGALAIGAVLWAIGGLVVLVCLQWFTHQPYSVQEKLVDGTIGRDQALRLATMVLRNSMALCLYLFPLFAGFAVGFPFRDRRALTALGACMLAGILFAGVWHASGHELSFLLAPFARDGSVVGARGLFDFYEMVGRRPVILGNSWWLAITVLVALISFCALIVIFYCRKQNRSQEARGWSAGRLLVLLGPTGAAYLFLLVPRAALHGTIYDRYLLPLLLLLVGPLILFYQRHIAEQLPPLTVSAVLVMAILGTVGLHDVFALYRARVAAANEILSAGYQRQDIRGGIDYDGWTQINVAGYIDEPLLRVPAGAYDALPRKDATCKYWFSPYTPAIDAKYALSHDPTACQGQQTFAPVPFRTWLPPYGQSVFIVRAR